jgi:hypothetical protein
MSAFDPIQSRFQFAAKRHLGHCDRPEWLVQKHRRVCQTKPLVVPAPVWEEDILLVPSAVGDMIIALLILILQAIPFSRTMKELLILFVVMVAIYAFVTPTPQHEVAKRPISRFGFAGMLRWPKNLGFRGHRCCEPRHT